MKEKTEILVVSDNLFYLSEAQLEQIREAAPGISLSTVSKPDPASPLIQKAEIIYGHPGAASLPFARNLKWLHLSSAGADSYTDRKKYINEDITVTNSSGVFSVQIAEHVLSMIFAFNRDLHIYIRNQQKKIWDRKLPYRNFYGSTIGIIGLGDIGGELAKRAHALGAKVLAVKRTPAERPPYVDELYTGEGIDTLLERSDYVVLALPATSRTAGVISRERLGKMKNDALIINIGRGSLIDQDALINALREHRIGGAGLDVTSPEPLPAESPLWELPNVIISPHTSGFSPINNELSFNIFYDNLKRYLKNEPLRNLVDFEAGY